MKDNKKINEKTEEILGQVADVTDNLYGRVKKIDFSSEILANAGLEDLKLHLGYTRNYVELARVRLQYMKFGEEICQ